MSVLLSGAGENAAYDKPFVESCVYDPAIPEPGAFLGYEVGSHPVSYAELFSYFQTLAQAKENIRLYPYGETHEGRKLLLLVVSSPENMQKLDEIKAGIQKLFDPRMLKSETEADALIQNTPAVAWMAYSIHGDELSSTDAAVWLAYQLAAGQDGVTQQTLREAVVCIDPLQNPDGRERFLAQMRSFNGKILNPDVQSANHTGLWPWGRGNHYFFDLNRDFFILSQPESRARVKTFLEWRPQLMVDSHEMGPLDTYLFSPPREPVNQNLTPMHEKWSKRFAEDQAKAFDRYGWSYYTREWLDMFYPGYSEWIAYSGALMILYEQAGVDGSAVRRADGTTMTYRETVHHHIVSSLANLQTLADNRQELLTDYYREKKKTVAPPADKEVCAYLIEPATNAARTNRLIENLLWQGIEIYQAQKPFTAKGLASSFGDSFNEKELPAGAWIIPVNQPQKHVLNAVMEFDPRMKDSFLTEERRELEKKNATRLYDVTAWSMPIAYGATCYQATAPVNAEMDPIRSFTKEPIAIPSHPKYGYVLDGSDDASTFAVSSLLEKGFAIRAAERDFHSGGKSFVKGSFLLRNVENSSRLHAEIPAISHQSGAVFHAADSALDLEGTDLGGQYFILLTPPRIGLFLGRTVSASSFGQTWNWLDAVYGARVSCLDIELLSALDLRKYNALILPSMSALPEGGVILLKVWVENGGTLIALGSAVSFLTDPKAEMSAVRERSEALPQMELYDEAVDREEKALTASASQADIWDYQPSDIKDATETAKKKEDIEKLKRQDAWEKRFSPRGAFLRARVDEEHWLAFGVNNPLAVIVRSSNSYYSKPPVETPVRFAAEKNLRVSGLVWPEARRRWAKSAYLTREAKGKGQIILFPCEPDDRGYYPETTRLLWNAVFLGPGLGAKSPIPW
ncbi:MAG: M14 family metallopeptidase [Candidatus Omnitrophota bacterium]